MLNRTDAYLVLNLLPDVGPIRVGKLLAHFQTPEAILSAKRAELIAVSGIGPEIAERFVDWENRVDLAEEKRRMKDHDVTLLTRECDLYPPSLREIYDPPFLLYMRGRIQPRDAQSIGIVGSRRTTHYGTSNGKKLSFQLAKAGFTIVSGLARGIDTVAHEAALAAGGRTIAVLGSGVGNIYPPENLKLAEEIAKNGAVLSEFPVLYVPDKKSFPMRNRIVAGMTQGLLVVEAPARSGSLITANQALEQGKHIFAVPGPIDRPTSVGCNRLIQAGAKLVCDAADVIEEFTYDLQPELKLNFDEPEVAANHLEVSDHERIILEALGDDELPLDLIIDKSNLPLAVVNAVLLKLEMKAAIKQLPGKYFTKLH